METCFMRVTAPHFVAGIEWQGTTYENFQVSKVAPILYWVKKRRFSVDEFIEYCNRKNWRIKVL